MLRKKCTNVSHKPTVTVFEVFQKNAIVLQKNAIVLLEMSVTVSTDFQWTVLQIQWHPNDGTLPNSHIIFSTVACGSSDMLRIGISVTEHRNFQYRHLCLM